jgi:hypothetical protein
VEAGYEMVKRMTFLGSMTNTVRTVKGMPFASTLLASWWSNMSYKVATLRSLSAIWKTTMNFFLGRSLGSSTHDGVLDACWAGDLFAERLDILDPSLVLLETVGRETDELHTTSSKVVWAASDFAELGGANWGKVIYERGLVNSSRSAIAMKSYQDERRE